MLFFSYTAVALALACAGAAAFILTTKKDTSALYFGWYILCAGIWVGSNGFADISPTEPILRFWCGISLISGTVLISFYLSFVEYFLTERPLSTLRRLVYFGPIVFFAGIAFTRQYVQEVYITAGQPAQTIIPGYINYLVLLFSFGGLGYGLYRLIRSYRPASQTKRLQIFYIATGYSILVVAGMIFTVIFPIFGEFRFYTFGSEFTLFTILAAAYAIFKHRLLDIRIVLQLGLIYTVLLSCIVLFYIGILFITLVFVNTNSKELFFSAALITTIAGIFGVPVIEKRFRMWTDRLFFKDRYNFAHAVHELSGITSRYNNIEDIVRHSSMALEKLLRARQVSFHLLQEYVATIAFGEKKAEHMPVIAVVVPYRLEDIAALPNLREHDDSPCEVRMPLMVEEKCIGMICVEEKKSGALYTTEDLRLLRTFSRQAAVALKKALLFQEVLDYSDNLMVRVNERTAEIKSLQENQTQRMLDISHELQTPLTIIKGELGLLRQVVPDDASLMSFEKSIDRISSFVKSLLTLARLETSIENTPKTELVLSEVVEEVVEYVTVLANEADIVLISDITQNIRVVGNKDQLERVVTNLLSNAMKYIANERKITVRLTAQASQVTLVVEDTGIGIAKADLPNLFKRFHRLSSPQQIPGTGLGLAMCETIIKNHNGTIDVESEQGSWTRVTVRLPR